MNYEFRYMCHCKEVRRTPHIATQAILDSADNEVLELKIKLAAAQDYINISVGDPDVTKEIWDAYVHYKTVMGEREIIGYNRFKGR